MEFSDDNNVHSPVLAIYLSRYLCCMNSEHTTEIQLFSYLCLLDFVVYRMYFGSHKKNVNINAYV